MKAFIIGLCTGLASIFFVLLTTKANPWMVGAGLMIFIWLQAAVTARHVDLTALDLHKSQLDQEQLFKSKVFKAAARVFVLSLLLAMALGLALGIHFPMIANQLFR